MRASALNVLFPVVAVLFASPVRAEGAPATVEVVVSVSGAKVEIDDRVVAASAEGPVRVELSPGAHVVRVTKEGFAAQAKRVDVPAGPPVRVEVALRLSEESGRRGVARIAVQSLDGTGETDARVAAIVTEALLAEVRKLDRTSAIGTAELGQMLSFEQQRQLMGCDDSGCLAELAGALGVDDLVSGSIGTLGGSVLFTVRRADVTKARVLGSVTRRLPTGTGEELLAEIGPVVQELFPEFELREGRRRGASTELARRLNPPPVPRWAFYATAGATVVGALLSAGAGAAFAGAQGEYRALADVSSSSGVSGARLMEVAGRVESTALQANVAIGVTLVLAVATGVLVPFTDFGDAGAQVALLPVPTGVAVAGRF